MTYHNHLFRFARPSQAGFTLVELMVGLAIGMLATLVVMQVFSVFEVQKRTTTGSADAQTNGNIALYTVTRDLELAGYALMPTGSPGIPDSALECGSAVNATVVPASGVVSLSPVTIADGIGNSSDTVTIRYGTSLMGGIPTNITAPVSAGMVAFPVKTNLGCAPGDTALVMNGAICAMAKLSSAVQVATTITFENDETVTAGAAVKDGQIACLGTWNEITYSVDTVNGNLLQNGVPIVAGVVNMQAQYGIGLSGLTRTDPTFNKVDQWVDATGIFASPTVINRNLIKAVRIAIIARSATREPNVVSKACSSIAAANPTGVCAWDATAGSPPTPHNAPTVDLSLGGHADWDHYHYKVFETTIPLRNVMWAKDTL